MKNKKLLTIISISAILGLTALSADCNKTKCNTKKCETIKCDIRKGEQQKCNMREHNMQNHHGKMMGDGGETRLFSGLNLTDTQKKSLQNLRSSEKMDRKNSMMKNHGDAMSNSVAAYGFDKAKFIKISAEQFNARIAKKADHMEKVFAILTPAQKVQLNKKLHEKR